MQGAGHRTCRRTLPPAPCHLSPFFLLSSDRAGDAFLGGAQSEERFHEEIDGYRGVALFHLGHPGLAGVKLLCKLELGEAALFPLLGQRASVSGSPSKHNSSVAFGAGLP